ncbi:MAG: DUF4339 domain-containing protein [Bryobacteraceae bacterium]|nr:DUF4339 domain-containing protein [Bryobacteraceae bacterium]
MYSTEPGVGKPGRTAPDWGLLGNLIWIIPLALFGLDGWLTYRARWYYWRGGSEVGTFSAYQLNKLYKTGQIDSKTPIRQVKDDGWHTGVATEDPPRRFGRGLCYAILAGIVGFFLSYALFGHVRGNYLGPDDLFGEVDPVRVGYLNGLSEEQMREVGLIRMGALVGEIAPTPFAPGAKQGAKYIDTGYELMVQKVERARTLTLGGAALFTALGAFGGAATAKGRARIYKERRVIFKKRRRESSDHE